MISYLLEFGFLLASFSLLYYFFFRKSTQYTLRRNVISTVLLGSVIIPFSPAIQSNLQEVYQVLLPAVSIGGQELEAGTVAGFSISIFTILIALYILISAIIAFRFLFGIGKLIHIISKGRIEKKQFYTLVYSDQIAAPGSFFRYILVPKHIEFEESEYQMVLKHESYHISFNHTIERLLFEIAKVVFWWHPAVWFLSKQQNLVHEYEVDEAMTQTSNLTLYKQLLLKLTFSKMELACVNPISSNIKKRIHMLNSKKQFQHPMAKASFWLLLGFTAFIIHSCQTEESMDKAENRIIETLETPISSEDESYVRVSTDTIVTFNPDTYEESVKIVSSERRIYKKADVMPMFPGCDSNLKGDELLACSTKKLLEFVYANIEYPEAARKKRIEGMVLVRFLVNKLGAIESEVIVRSVPELDPAVTKMINKLKNENIWIPGKKDGKNVAVEYTLPVKFKLEG